MLSAIVHARPDGAAGQAGAENLVTALEDGAVVVFDDLPFPLQPFEQRFFERPFSDGKAKNVSIRGTAGTLKGAGGTPDEMEALRQLMIRYRSWSQDLIRRHFPDYADKIAPANTSYRPFDISTRKLSWRRDDTRLHVDAFPSNPIGEKRILRIFRNMNTSGKPRVWRVGEDFASMADRFLPRVPRYSRISAQLLAGIGVTKSLRSEYDHLMLHLHDALKKDEEYQSKAPQQTVEFAPGQTWVTFSDLVLHAAMGGEYMLEQTMYLPLEAQKHPEKSPHAMLSRKLGRPLS